MSLTFKTIKEAKEGLQNKEFTVKELVQEHIDRIEAHRQLNAYVTDTFEQALTQAEQAQQRYNTGEARGLEGIPLGIKDLYCTKGVKTTACSKILHNFVPPYESTVTQNLFDAGAIMLGKLNMDEFAMGSANLYSHFGAAKSPWKNGEKHLVPGGSSGGSAGAVAGYLAMGATGSDTGGSIRQPAAFCGIVGIKPTYGRCSRYGMMAFASSLDQAGPITRSVYDAALLLEHMASFDAKDATSKNVKVPSYAANINKDIKGLKVGIPKEYNMSGMDPEIGKAWEEAQQWLKAQGAELVEVSLPNTQYALPAYYIIAPAEASSNLARYDGVRYGHRAESFENLNDMYCSTRGEGFGAEVKKRLIIGTYVLSAGHYDAYYLKAKKVQQLIRNDFKNAFKDVDVMLTPTTPTPAFTEGEEPKDPVTMYLNDVLTVSANIAGIPGMSVPTHLTQAGLPIGMQLLGPHFREDTLFNVGAALEEVAQFPMFPKQ